MNQSRHPCCSVITLAARLDRRSPPPRAEEIWVAPRPQTRFVLQRCPHARTSKGGPRGRSRGRSRVMIANRAMYEERRAYFNEIKNAAPATAPGAAPKGAKPAAKATRLTPLVTYRKRRAIQIENDAIRVTMLAEGGHIAEILQQTHRRESSVDSALAVDRTLLILQPRSTSGVRRRCRKQAFWPALWAITPASIIPAVRRRKKQRPESPCMETHRNALFHCCGRRAHRRERVIEELAAAL